MRETHHTLLTIGVFVFASSCVIPARAQSDAASISGHWKGSVQVQAMQLNFEVDIAKTAHGDLTGTISLPSQQIKGLPLLKVAIDGNVVSFYARDDQPFRGTIADGTIAGDMTVEGLVAPFTMTRSGDAAIEAPPRNTGIAKELAGTWNGALGTNGRQLRLIMVIAPQADGTMIAEMTDVDEGGLKSPLRLTQQGASLTIESVAIPAKIAGALNVDNTELVGTFTQGPASLPLTLHRAPAGKDK
jgi:hypothetical protein